MRRPLLLLALASLASVCVPVPALAQQQPTAAFVASVLNPGDRAALDAALNKETFVEGVVQSAAWSGTGKVMNITFAEAGDVGLLAVVFERDRKRLDEAFGGDLAKELGGQRVRIRGTIKPYGGRDRRLEGRPQIIINLDSQITFVEDVPATQPGK